jgi:hypothetical protein
VAEDQDVVIKLIADRQSANQTKATVDGLKKDIRAAFSSDAALKFRTDVKSINKEFDDLRKSIGKAADEKKRLETAAPNSGAGGKLLGATGRAADAIAPQVGGAIRAFEDIKEFGTSLSDVGKLAVGAGVGIGAAAVALTALQAQAQKVKEAATIELNARAEVIAFIQTATQAEIEARRDELRQKQAIAQAVANDAASVLAQTEAQTNVIGKLNATLGTNQGELSAAREAADNANKALGETNTALTLLDQAAAAGFASTRDLALAEQELADVRAKERSAGVIATAQQLIDLSAKTRAEQALSVDQITARLEASKAEAGALQFAINSLVLSGDKSEDVAKKLTEYQVALGRLGAEQARLTDTVLPLAEARERETESAKAQIDAQKELAKVNGDLQSLQAKKTEDLAAIADKYAQSLSELNDAFDQANRDAEAEKQQQLADLGKQLQQDQADSALKFTQDRIKIEEDYQKRIVEIQREFTRSSTQAIQDRDAVALDAAERKRESDLTDAADGRKEQLRERERQYKEELRTLQVNNQRQLAELNASYQREAQQRAAKLANDQRQLADAQSREIAQRTAAYNKQLAELQKYLATNNSLWQQAGQALVNYAKSVKDAITANLNGGNAGVANGAITPSPTNPIDLGGIFGGGGSRSLSSSGGTGLRAPTSTSVGGGVSVAVNGVGMGKGAVIREVTKQLDTLLTDAGF